VADRNPRAFLVISPLLSKPELLEKVSSYSWTEIKEQLQEPSNSPRFPRDVVGAEWMMLETNGVFVDGKKLPGS